MITVNDWDGEQTNVVIHGSFDDVHAKIVAAKRLQIDCTITSPPYSTDGGRLPSSRGNATKRIRTDESKYESGGDIYDDEVYRAWTLKCVDLTSGVVFWNVPPKLSKIHTHAITKPFGEVIWKKDGGTIPFARKGVIYAHEYILLFGNHEKLTKPVRSIWGMVPQRKSLHPAPFPIQLPAKAIRHATCQNDLVFDPFGGSGTTAAVAKATGRRWLTCDISAQYCEWMDDRIKKTEVL